MAEIKRIPLQSAPIPDKNIGSQTSKKSKKEKTKQIAPSIRFVLNLSESNEEKCPEFNYAQLLKSEEKKKRKEKKKEENNVTNGSTPLDDDNDEKVLDVARYFEEKYGNRKKNDYVDLGAGYDESDSFIDNTDAYDELVPEEVTTVYGGFYVNSGPLEFKNSDNVRLLHRNSIDNENGNDDEESSDEDSEEDCKEDEVVSTKEKRANKRTISSSDDNDEVEEILNPKSKPRTDKAEYSTAD